VTRGLHPRIRIRTRCLDALRPALRRRSWSAASEPGSGGTARDRLPGDLRGRMVAAPLLALAEVPRSAIGIHPGHPSSPGPSGGCWRLLYRRPVSAGNPQPTRLRAASRSVFTRPTGMSAARMRGHPIRRTSRHAGASSYPVYRDPAGPYCGWGQGVVGNRQHPPGGYHAGNLRGHHAGWATVFSVAPLRGTMPGRRLSDGNE